MVKPVLKSRGRYSLATKFLILFGTFCVVLVISTFVIQNDASMPTAMTHSEEKFDEIIHFIPEEKDEPEMEEPIKVEPPIELPEVPKAPTIEIQDAVVSADDNASIKKSREALLSQCAN